MEIRLEDIFKITDSFDAEEKRLYEQRKIEHKFIRNLVNERKKRGITQKELAAKSGLSQQAISMLEHYDRKPTLPNLIKYLTGLGIDINSIFD